MNGKKVKQINKVIDFLADAGQYEHQTSYLVVPQSGQTILDPLCARSALQKAKKLYKNNQTLESVVTGGKQ